MTSLKDSFPVSWVLRGEQITMGCIVNATTCGQYHSVKWYRDELRVAVYSPTNNWYRVEDMLTRLDKKMISVEADNNTVSLSWNVVDDNSEGLFYL